jgi:hypothetical protein
MSANRIPAAKRVEIAITHLMTVGCVYEGWNPIAVMIPKESQIIAFRSINRLVTRTAKEGFFI